MEKKESFEEIDLKSITPKYYSVPAEDRPPLIQPVPTVWEYIMNNIQVLIIVSLIILAALFIFNSKILDNVFGSCRSEPATCVTSTK